MCIRDSRRRTERTETKTRFNKYFFLREIFNKELYIATSATRVFNQENIKTKRKRKRIAKLQSHRSSVKNISQSLILYVIRIFVYFRMFFNQSLLTSFFFLILKSSTFLKVIRHLFYYRKIVILMTIITN